VRDGKPGLKILPPLYALTKEDEYTAELREILYG
jgi:tRNA1(Val) A37 N6-methylase TrmN6